MVTHTKTKHVPQLRFPEFESEWESTTLGEVGTIIRGASPRPKGDKRYYGGSVPRLMVQDITRDGKYVIPKIDFLTEEGAALSRPCQKGTLVVVCSGTVGIPAILAVDACIHDGFLAFQNISNGFSVDFLYAILSTLQKKFDSSATHGGVFVNLTTTILKKFSITYPALSEQQKIAEFLSAVDGRIDQLRRKKELLTQYKTGLMQQLFSQTLRFTDNHGHPYPNWGEKQLGPMTTKIGSGVTPKGGAEVYQETGIPLLRSQNVKDNRLDLSDVAYISDEINQSMSGSIVQPNDVLLNITGASIGRSCIVPESITIANVNQHVCIIRPFQNLKSSYLQYFLSSHTGQKLIFQSQSGSGREGVNFANIRKFKIPYPHPDEQQEIAACLSAIDDQITHVSQQLAHTQTFKQGLLQQMFV